MVGHVVQVGQIGDVDDVGGGDVGGGVADVEVLGPPGRGEDIVVSTDAPDEQVDAVGGHEHVVAALAPQVVVAARVDEDVVKLGADHILDVKVGVALGADILFLRHDSGIHAVFFIRGNGKIQLVLPLKNQDFQLV